MLDLGAFPAYLEEAAAPRVRCRRQGVLVAAVPGARQPLQPSLAAVGVTPVTTAGAMVGGAVLHVTERMLDDILHRPTQADRLLARDLADQEARSSINRLETETFSQFSDRWDQLGQSREKDALVADTQRLLLEQTRALYVAWDAATRADWTNSRFHDRCRRLAADLRHVHGLLSAGAAQPAEVSPVLARMDRTSQEIQAYRAPGSPIHSID